MDYWQRVRSAFASSVEASLSTLGIQLETGGGTNHRAIKCPFCDDSGGSASVDRTTGFLKCHQCGVALPLFDWVAKHKGTETAWDAAKALGEHYKIELPVRGKGRPKAALSVEEVELCVPTLWGGELGEPFRSALKQRGFQQTQLAKYHLGCRAEGLIFPAITPDGAVKARAHVWRGHDADPRWMWTAGTGETNYLWPLHFIPPKGEPIWLTEGEWDCLVLREHFALHAYTWTGGASAPLRLPALPNWLVNRDVVVCYDNDVWQGLDLKSYFAETDKERDELLRRRKNLIEGVCGSLAKRLSCRVKIAKVPIPASEKWGADIRDWWSAGGRNILELELTPYEEAAVDQVVYEQVDLNAGIAGRSFVSFTCRAVSMDTQARMVPKTTTVNCPRGVHAYCSRCTFNSTFRGNTIVWEDERERRAMIWSSSDPNKEIIRHVVGKPSACNQCELQHSQAGESLYLWQASGADAQVQQQEVAVLSTAKPDLFSDLQVDGKVLTDMNGFALLVDAAAMTISQRSPIALDRLQGPLRYLTPWDATSLEAIDAYMQRRARDLAFNVTKIRGQARVHLAFDLVMHSPLWMAWGGKRKRGWIDATLIGVTRCGKTDAIRSLHQHYGRMGEVVSTQQNYSVSGLTVAHHRSHDGAFRAKPGVFPRNHNRFVALDEFHSMRDNLHGASPIEALQEARDQGFVHAMKSSGSVTFPAAVRLLTIANPPDQNGFACYQYPCEAITDLYPSPESIARLDFAVIVTDEDKKRIDQTELEPEAHEWTGEMCNALARRAWKLCEEDSSALVFEEAALQFAEDAVAGWHDLSNQTIPLVTGHEKLISVLRIAASVANMCFSHRIENPMGTIVRACHVEWAVNWLQELWISSGFISYSENAPDRKKLIRPFEVEAALLKTVQDERSAIEIFGRMLRPTSRMELCAILGQEPREFDKWIGYMVSHRAMDVSTKKTGAMICMATKGGNRMLRDLIDLAHQDPEGFANRRRALLQWDNSAGPSNKVDPNLLPFGEAE